MTALKKGNLHEDCPVIKVWFGHYYFLVVSFLVVSIPTFSGVSILVFGESIGVSVDFAFGGSHATITVEITMASKPIFNAFFITIIFKFSIDTACYTQVTQIKKGSLKQVTLSNFMELRSLFFNRILLGFRSVHWLFGGIRRHLLGSVNYFGSVGGFDGAVGRSGGFCAVAGCEGNGYQGR